MSRPSPSSRRCSATAWSRLRPHRDSDEAAIVEQCQDPESVRWTSAPRPYGAGAGPRVHQRGRPGVGPGRQPGVGGGGGRPADAAGRGSPGTHRLPPGRRRRGRARVRAAPGRARTRGWRPGGAAGDHLGLRPGRHRGHALARVRRQLGLPAYGVAVRLPGRGHRAAAAVRERQAVRRLGRVPDQGRADGAGCTAGSTCRCSRASGCACAPGARTTRRPPTRRRTTRAAGSSAGSS